MSVVLSKPEILMITDGNRDHSSSRIRALQYIPYLEKAGYRVKWLPRIPEKNRKSAYNRLKFAFLKRLFLLRIVFHVFSENYKVLFVQRFFLPKWLIGQIRRKKKKLIFDFDDAIYISAIDKNAEQKTLSVIKAANHVITSCPFLFEFSNKINQNIAIITSPVDSKKIVPNENKNETLTIGWIGSEWTSKYLSILEPVLEKLSEKYKFRILLVGADSVQLSGEISREKWSPETETALLQTMDIGVMPLFDNEFERAKGGFKLFQYMAAGKPVLASPVGINREIVVHGKNGFLCETGEEWYLRFCELLDDKNLRQEMGNFGRKRFLENYSLDVCAVKLIDILNKLTE